MSNPVKLYVYDLSNGLAKQLSRQLTGKQIDGVWSVFSFSHVSTCSYRICQVQAYFNSRLWPRGLLRAGY